MRYTQQMVFKAAEDLNHLAGKDIVLRIEAYHPGDGVTRYTIYWANSPSDVILGARWAVHTLIAVGHAIQSMREVNSRWSSQL